MEKGEWSNSVSHIKTKGSGGGDENNVVPMCLTFCHQEFEKKSKTEKQKYIPLAIQIYKNYLTAIDICPTLKK